MQDAFAEIPGRKAGSDTAKPEYRAHALTGCGIPAVAGCGALPPQRLNRTRVNRAAAAPLAARSLRQRSLREGALGRG